MMTTTSDYIKTSINNVISTGFQAAALAVIIIFLFLGDWRNSLVIGISIPTSIMATLVMMYLCNMTMNTISMGGIVIGIGMLVDNSVVVLENISSYYNRGYSPEDAAYEGTQEVAMAIAASTLTSVAVFAPLAFVSGTIGAMLKEVAMTICFALAASIVVALTFVPMALALSTGTESMQTLGIAVIFGLSISTLLTLLFIPVLYSLINSALKKLGIVWRGFLDKHFPYDEIEEE